VPTSVPIPGAMYANFFKVILFLVVADEIDNGE